MYARIEMCNSVAPTPGYHAYMKRSIAPKGESEDWQRTAQVQACPYAGDGLPVPLDRCNLRMLERA